jgi:beta-glucanase (GH16 family)
LAQPTRLWLWYSFLGPCLLWIFLLFVLLIVWPRDSQIASQLMNQATWSLVWSDEFNGSVGSPVNSTNWTLDVGDGCSAHICGWGNNEKEYYTDEPANVSLNGSGQLVMVARVASTALSCYYGPCRYTSARIKTQAKFEQRYGRFEARIKLPWGQGLWPAFWMLGANAPTTPWPDCGEIDIMEFHGSHPNSISSALHGPGYSGNTPIVHTYTLHSGTFADEFHVFAMEWEPEHVRFYVDNSPYSTVTKATVEQYGARVFDHPFFIILNLAVGGNFDGDPKSNSIFPATMLVDYVRVYR